MTDRLTESKIKLNNLAKLIHRMSNKPNDNFKKQLNQIDMAVGNFCDFYFHSQLVRSNFNWLHGSKILASDYPEYISLWWDSNKFNWINYSHLLPRYCSDSFDIWWVQKKYRWSYRNSNLIEKCSNNFDKWWKPHYFRYDIESVLLLMEHCPKKFNIWWNKEILDRIYIDNYFVINGKRRKLKTILENNFQEFDHIWKPDVVIWKLKHGKN